MRVVIQRVKQASVTIEGRVHAQIGAGLLVLAGYEPTDTAGDIEYVCHKIANLRIFNDDAGVMNKSILETGGEILLVSQFTLHAATKKGNRPSYIRAAKPEQAIPLYHQSISMLEKSCGKPIATGEFGADMLVDLSNDGPVTIILDSQLRDF